MASVPLYEQPQSPYYHDPSTYQFPAVATQGELESQTPFGASWEAFGDDEYDDEDMYYDPMMDPYYGMMYQDGIDEDSIYDEENARRYRHRRGHRHARPSMHRYPHHTHQRRVTPHSFGDQGPTHFGQQHPYHTTGHAGADLVHPTAGHPLTHPLSEADGQTRAPQKKKKSKTKFIQRFQAVLLF